MDRHRVLRHIALIAVTAALLIGVWGNGTLANPPGTKLSDVGKKLYSFNVIAIPNDAWGTPNTNCPNNGHRIFFNRVTSGAIGTILWVFDPTATQNFDILDCNGTSDGDKTGAVTVNEQLSFYVFVRIVGKKTDSLTLTCTDQIDVGADDLCLIGTPVTINKGKSFTKIMSNVFDNSLEQVLWTLETSTGFRIAQVWIFEKL